MRFRSRTGCALFLDGEVIVGDDFEATQEHFRSRGRRGDAGVLHLFDQMAMTEWRKGRSVEPLTARRTVLDAMAEDLTGNAVRILPWRWLTTTAEIEARAREIIAGGGEGMVIKSPSSIYERRRSETWLKIKAQHLGAAAVSARPILRPRFSTGATI